MSRTRLGFGRDAAYAGAVADETATSTRSDASRLNATDPTKEAPPSLNQGGARLLVDERASRRRAHPIGRAVHPGRRDRLRTTRGPDRPSGRVAWRTRACRN